MKAGAGQIDVTPPTGCWLLGPVAPSTGVHDPLYARAIVLDDGDRRVAILGIDLIGFGWEFSDILRERIAREAGVDDVFLQLSHTHSAPFPPSWMTSIYERDRERLAPWRDQLTVLLPQMVSEAVKNLQPATLRTGRSAVQVGYNRRLMGDSEIIMEPNTDGLVVPWVDTLSAHNENGEAFALLYCHAAHPVIVHRSSTEFSADYPGYACARIRETIGNDIVPIFVQGCGGNIIGDWVASGFAKAQKAGNDLGDAVVSAMENATKLTPAKLSLAGRTVQLPCTDFPPIDEVEERLAKYRKNANGEHQVVVTDRIAALEDLIRLITIGERPTMRMDISFLGLASQWLYASMSGEVFSEYQLWIDKHAPFDTTMISAYSSNFGGYIPTDADLQLGAGGDMRPRAGRLNLAP